MTEASNVYAIAREHHASSRRLLDAAMSAYLADDIGGGFAWQIDGDTAIYTRAPVVDCRLRSLILRADGCQWTAAAIVAPQPKFGGYGHDIVGVAAGAPRAALASLLHEIETDNPGHVHPDDLADVVRTLRHMVRQ